MRISQLTDLLRSHELCVILDSDFFFLHNDMTIGFTIQSMIDCE